MLGHVGIYPAQHFMPIPSYGSILYGLYTAITLWSDMGGNHPINRTVKLSLQGPYSMVLDPYCTVGGKPTRRVRMRKDSLLDKGGDSGIGGC